MITASALSRLMNCPGSVVLPRAENASEWAERGHEEHAELAVGVGETGHEWEHLIPPGSRSEVALAFDVATRVGRILGENLDRAYGSVRPFEIVGSADVVGVDGDTVVVLDFKTGYADVEPAHANTQLAFYALAACRALGKQRAIVRIVYTKQHRVDEATLDALDLAAFADRLASLHSRVAELHASKKRGEPVPTNEGAWCKHCASKPYCGSKTALLAQVASGGLAVIGDSVMTAERARTGYEQIIRLEQLVKDAKKRLNQYVDETGPIDLGNGRMYGRFHRQGDREISGELAVRAIREVVGESAKEFERIAFKRETSQAAIERAAKALSPATRGAASGLKKKVLARLEELGGITRPSEYPIGEYDGAKHQAAQAPEVDLEDVDRRMREAG